MISNREVALRIGLASADVIAGVFGWKIVTSEQKRAEPTPQKPTSTLTLDSLVVNTGNALLEARCDEFRVALPQGWKHDVPDEANFSARGPGGTDGGGIDWGGASDTGFGTIKDPIAAKGPTEVTISWHGDTASGTIYCPPSGK